MNQMFNSNHKEVMSSDASAVLAKTFMANVFSWMTLALTVSGVFAYWFGSSPALMSLIVGETGMNFLGYVVIFAPFLMVLAMGAGFHRFSFGTLVLLFSLFSILMGISLSFIFLAYTMASIAKVFFITAGTFGAMALVGYTTKTDLTRLGSLLFMALIGIIIASLVNMFMGSARLDYIISVLGVIIFTGLTAYDVQKLKRIGMGLQYSGVDQNKLVIMGAMNLYLDFINLFLFLLRLFGDRR